MRLYHGSMDLSQPFDDVLPMLRSFFATRHPPTETVVMAVTNELNTNQDVFAQKLKTNYIDRIADLFWVGDYVPQMQDVRGKVVLLRRFGLGSSPSLFPKGFGLDFSKGWSFGAGGSTFSYPSKGRSGVTITGHVQDDYTDNAAVKLGALDAMRAAAQRDTDPNSIYVSFASTSGDAKNLWLPYYNSVVVNPDLRNSVENSVRLGWIPMDYPEYTARLVYVIAASNLPIISTAAEWVF